MIMNITFPSFAAASPSATIHVLRPWLTQKTVATRPLRVVRVLEANQPRSQVGRMTISGRMADVCAELERLAAFE